MASAILNKPGLAASEVFLDPPTSAAAPFSSSYGWLSPRISFSCEFSDEDKPRMTSLGNDADLDFEFIQADDPVAMLPADELFSDGKLVPQQLAAVRPTPEASATSSLAGAQSTSGVIQPQVPEKTLPKASDPYTAFSPKAPTCTGRWRELLRLRRTAQRSDATRSDAQKSSCKCSSSTSALAVAAASSSGTSATRSLKHFLHRNPRPSASSADPDSDSVRRSSIPSSAPDHDDHPRLSLDADRSGDVSISLCRSRLRLAPRGSPTGDSSARAHQGGRAGRPPARRSSGEAPASRSASVDSPRMNSSGKVVFQGLGRSSSSPSALHGGPRGKSHPASVVRVAPVLNVPVSVFGLGQLFSAPQKKDPAAGSSSSGAARSSASASGGGGGGKADRA